MNKNRPKFLPNDSLLYEAPRLREECKRSFSPAHRDALKESLGMFEEELLRRGLGRVGVVAKVEAEKLLKEYTACSLERFHRYGY